MSIISSSSYEKLEDLFHLAVVIGLNCAQSVLNEKNKVYQKYQLGEISTKEYATYLCDNLHEPGMICGYLSGLLESGHIDREFYNDKIKKVAKDDPELLELFLKLR